MSDDSALLRAIADAPDDIHLRLVYADFCEEHGRDARAALIRGQCALDPVLADDKDSPFFSGRTDRRYLFARDLPLPLRADVLAPFRPYAESAGRSWAESGFLAPGSDWFAIRRGFVEYLNLIGLSVLEHWLTHSPRVPDQVPIRSLTVHRFVNYYGEDDTQDDPAHLPPHRLAALCSSTGFDRLRVLDLTSFTLGAAAARILLGVDGFRPERLRLRYRSLSARIIADLKARFGEALHLQDAADDIPF